MSTDPRKTLSMKIENEMSKMHSTFGIAEGMKNTAMISLINEMTATILTQFDRIVELEALLAESEKNTLPDT